MFRRRSASKNVRGEDLFRIDGIEDVMPPAELAVHFDVAALFDYGAHFIVPEHAHHGSG